MEGGMEGRGGTGDKVGKSDLKRKGKNLADIHSLKPVDNKNFVI
jgi:hypothetical protein